MFDDLDKRLDGGTFWALAMADEQRFYPSQSSVGQTGIERHPMAPPIVA